MSRYGDVDHDQVEELFTVEQEDNPGKEAYNFEGGESARPYTFVMWGGG